MCLILFSHQAESRFPLVVAANRDELYSRPTRPADFWPDSESATAVLAGKDLLAGGTWLGITRGGRFAAVTNIRDPSQAEQKARSRGELTLGFLQDSSSPGEFSAQVQSRFGEYAGFNLLVGDRESMYYMNNFENVREELAPGVYGLSNGLLNSPWPKVERGRALLTQMLDADHSPDTDKLLRMMNDRTEAADAELPDTGVPRALERILSSSFIYNPDRSYGTLCSTAIIVDANGNCRFAEQNYNAKGRPAAAQYYEFDMK